MKLTPTSYSITKMPAYETLKYWIESIERMSKIYDSATIVGTVKDCNNTIKNAFIVIMDEDCNPIVHGFTDEEGKYLLHVPFQGKYNILVTANGKRILYGDSFTVTLNDIKIINFILEDAKENNYSIIAGDIIESENMENHISSAIITLSMIDSQLNEELIDVTYSNESGQYMFTDLKPGTYNISISAKDYLNKVINRQIIDTGMVIPMTVTLEKDSKKTKGSISGIIKDFNNNPLGDTDVVLYSIDENNMLTPVSFTKSNENGLYLFVNIPKGNYKVMCKQDEVLNIDE